MRKVKCPKEEKLILLIYNEIKDNKELEELINHLSVCHHCEKKFKTYEKTIKKLHENSTILEKILSKETYKIDQKILALQYINRFLSSKLLIASTLTTVFIGFLILIFTMYPSDQMHNENRLSTKHLENSYLEKITFEFEEVEEEIKRGLIYYD